MPCIYKIVFVLYFGRCRRRKFRRTYGRWPSSCVATMPMTRTWKFLTSSTFCPKPTLPMAPIKPVPTVLHRRLFRRSYFINLPTRGSRFLSDERLIRGLGIFLGPVIPLFLSSGNISRGGAIFGGGRQVAIVGLGPFLITFIDWKKRVKTRSLTFDALFFLF